MSALEETESWMLDVVVRDKCIKVSCGAATQRVKWLGHVGIARYDDKTYQGWKQLGVPTKITKADGVELKDAKNALTPPHRPSDQVAHAVKVARGLHAVRDVRKPPAPAPQPGSGVV